MHAITGGKMDPYGYVIMVVVLSVLVQHYLAVQASLARQRYKVPVSNLWP